MMSHFIVKGWLVNFQTWQEIKIMEKADLWAAAERDRIQKELRKIKEEELAQWIWEMR